MAGCLLSHRVRFARQELTLRNFNHFRLWICGEFMIIFGLLMIMSEIIALCQGNYENYGLTLRKCKWILCLHSFQKHLY